MISILIPIYNGIEFLHEAIGSIQNQTFKEWEIIIGINGYPANSAVFKIAKKFESKNIRVYDLLNIKGKANALNGSYSDATPFNDYGIEDAKKILKSHGFNEYGYETLYNGMTGKKMKALMFIGPTYYLRF